MNTIAIVEEWDQDESSIDWSGFPEQQAMVVTDHRGRLNEEYDDRRYDLPAHAQGRRFGYFEGSLDLEDDDPE